MGRPVITALGLLSPLGNGVDDFTSAWRSGVQSSVPESAGGEGGFRVEGVKPHLLFPKHRGMIRRMDRLSRMLVHAAGLARDDHVGLGAVETMALGVGTDLGTLEETWKFLTRLREQGPALANPMDFPNLVPNAAAGYAGIFLGLQGPSHTFCQHWTCGDEAVAWTADGVRSGWFDAGLAGGVEELGPIRQRAATEADCQRLAPGAPGEGATCVLVEDEDRAAARGAHVRGRVLASILAARPRWDGILRRQVSGSAIEALIGRALEAADLSPAAVGALLLSHPADEVLVGACAEALGREVPQTDHDRRLGIHPADGALRVALGALLLSDRSLPVHEGGGPCAGSATLVVSVARGGALAATVLGAADS